jgi:TolB-like protein/tetratricopeptide (TPR) repeat protein
MSVGATPRPKPHADSRGRRLESWKEIATYLGRDVTTVRRWEKREGLPVHRLHHSRLGSVYAYTAELDAWRIERAAASPTGRMGANQAPQKVIRAQTVITFAMLGLLLAGGSAWLWRQRGTESSASAGSRIRSLAVLPLENLSGNPEQDYLADGMTEALIARLATVQGLRVTSRRSSMQFKGTHSSVPEIARKLNVGAVVEGSVIRSGDRIRISAQLIQGETDVHLWSGTFDRELRDVLGMQSEVAQSIAQQIDVTVTAQERGRLVAARAVSPEVYESYLKGRFALNKSTPAGDKEAIAHFENAIKREPTFAPAFAGLASAYSDLGTVFIGASPLETRPRVMATARKALELDPELIEAHVLLATELQDEWQWVKAEGEFKQAIELSPSDAGASDGYAMWLLCQGRTQEAIAWGRRASELDPLHGVLSIGWILFQARRYDEAIRELRSELTVDPENAGTLWWLGFALIGAERFDEAIATLERAASLSDRRSAVLGVLVGAYAGAGRRPEALQVLDELHRRRQHGYVPAAAFLNAYLRLGDKEEAFTWLGRAVEERSNIIQFLKVHPFFDPLRGDPRFAEFLRRANFSP